MWTKNTCVLAYAAMQIWMYRLDNDYLLTGLRKVLGNTTPLATRTRTITPVSGVCSLSFDLDVRLQTQFPETVPGVGPVICR
jgi:hypothetical protein